MPSNNVETEIKYENIPDELKERNTWICWREEERNGKTTKVPVEPFTGGYASATDPDTWTTFDKAYRYHRENASSDGVGFVFSEQDTLTGIDLDDCREPSSGDLDEWARDIIRRLDSFTEISPSGTGVHIIVHGILPGEGNRRGNVEMYDKARFFTVTGDTLFGASNDIKRRQKALKLVHEEYIQADDDDPKDNSTEGTPMGEVDIDDQELLEKAKNAENGENFRRLWNGNTSRYPSNSEADMALCCHLAFWTGGDPQRMDELFRKSGLMRNKWDEEHYSDGSTYGEKTIQRAISQTTEFYEDNVSDIEDNRDYVELTHAGENGRNSGYLEEKNRLLKQRVQDREEAIDELKETLKEKSERIHDLEDEIQQLRKKIEEEKDEEVNKDNKSLFQRLF